MKTDSFDKNDYRILVTGANGFIGFNLVQELLKRGYSVVGLHSQIPKHALLAEDKNYTYYLWDQKLEFLKEGKWIVFHFAALSDFLNSDSRELEVANVGLTQRLVHNLKSESDVFIYSSTVGVYDRGLFSSSKGPLTIKSKEKPKSKYGKSKLAGERAILNSGIRNIILRLAWVYGEDMKANSHLRAFFHWAESRRFITKFPWPGQVSVISVSDVVNFCVKLVEESPRNIVSGTVINLHEAQPICISSVLREGHSLPPSTFAKLSIAFLRSVSRVLPSKLRILLEPYLVFSQESALFEAQFAGALGNMLKKWQTKK
jgi:nucleoside-diphosphate-sugar epimerase